MICVSSCVPQSCKTPAPIVQVVFLDDLGVNLKTARDLGMATIKVEVPEEAIKQLEQILQTKVLKSNL